MARARNSGNGRLQAALESLLQSQASLAQAQASMLQAQTALAARQVEADARFAHVDIRFNELKTQIAETDRHNAERFARIEAILAEHHRAVEALTEAVRGKIGFKA